MVGWERFCNEVGSLIQTSERRIGYADRNFSLFIIERLQLAVVNLAAIYDVLRSANELTTFLHSVGDLVRAIRGGNSIWIGWTWRQKGQSIGQQCFKVDAEEGQNFTFLKIN